MQELNGQLSCKWLGGGPVQEITSHKRITVHVHVHVCCGCHMWMASSSVDDALPPFNLLCPHSATMTQMSIMCVFLCRHAHSHTCTQRLEKVAGQVLPCCELTHVFECYARRGQVGFGNRAVDTAYVLCRSRGRGRGRTVVRLIINLFMKGLGSKKTQRQAYLFL